MSTVIARLLAYPRDWLAMRTLPTAHPRSHIHTPRNAGEVVADLVVGGMGSWTFIIGQTVVVALWMILNTVAFIGHWDPMPFILLNLVFSTQAAYASPLILMAANRSAAKDHLRDDHEAEEVDKLYQINQQQLQILEQQSAILDALHALSQPKEGAA